MTHHVWHAEGNYFPEVVFSGSNDECETFASELQDSIPDYVNDDTQMVWVEKVEGPPA